MGELISVRKASVQLHMDVVTLTKRLDYIDCPIINSCFSKNKFDEIIRQKDVYVNLDKVLGEYIEEIKGKKIEHKFIRKLTVYSAGFEFWGADFIINPIFRKEIKRYPIYYIWQTDVPTIKSHVREMIVLYEASYIEKLEYLTQETALKTYADTAKQLAAFFAGGDEKRQSGIVEIGNYFRHILTKDLSECDNSELMEIMRIAEADLTGLGKAALIEFYAYLQTNFTSKSNLNIKYNRHKLEPPQSLVQPYDLKTYFSIAYMVMNRNYWDEHGMIQKAIEREMNAKVWLYHLMHFLCAWRNADIRNKLPRISLDDTPDVVFYKVKNEIYSQDYYRKIAEMISFKFRYNGNKNMQKPEKTMKHENTPLLKLTIPDGTKPVFGMLAVLCEAHNQKNKVTGALCAVRPFVLNDGVKLFDLPYCEVLNGVTFSNRRANKNYMNKVSEKGEKTEIDGYWLAFYARSHTGGLERIPEVTSRYLKAKMDGYSPDEVVRCLMERGVCSFVPYMLCSALDKGNFDNKHITEQTSDMKALAVSPSQIENILKLDSELSEICKKKVQEIIKWSNSNNLEAIAKQITGSIIDGNCYGKTEGVYCLAKACYKGCVQKQRESCIGCGHEMYVKSVLIELSLEILRQEKMNDSASTDGEKFKRTMILKNRLYPASQEILKTIKYVYHEDITEYLKILERGDEYAAFGII